MIMQFKAGMVLATLRMVARVAIPLGLFAACALALGTRLQDFSIERTVAHLASLTPLQWMLSLLCCGISFWAVGRYDAVAHRHLRTGLPDRQARRSGTIAIALSQTLGFGLVTGALARWRLLPGLSGRQALKLSSFVAFSFMASLAIVSTVALVLLPGPQGSFWPALAAMAAFPAVVWLLFRYPELNVLGHQLRLPSLPGFAAILLWTALDVTAAGLALYVLMPDEVAVTFAIFLPVFMLAIGMALISGIPGGVGPFELAVLMLLPETSQTGLVSGIVAFRALYYALPAFIASILLLKPFREVPEWGSTPRPAPDPTDYPRSELGVMRQNGGRWMIDDSGGLVVWATAQTFTGLFDPIAQSPGDLMQTLARVARGANRVACLYKCTARTALAARKQRWSVLHIADEAVIVLRDFSLDVPARRTLRRKLRASEKAGISFAVENHPDWDELACIDLAWQSDRGPARSGTMGKFDREYLVGQQIVTATRNGKTIAFASFHASNLEWCLDLVRMDPESPDGCMHGIVCCAIEAARKNGVQKLSLAAVPACPDPSKAIFSEISMRMAARAGGPGLRQFKSSFAPVWKPLYLAAPSRMALLIAALDIARVVMFAKPAPEARRSPHVDDENLAFACRRAS